MISPFKIKFNNKFSTDFNLIVNCAFDGDNGGTDTYLSKEAIYSDSYNGSRRKMHGYKYSDVLSAQITFIKKGFDDLTREENRAILSWLTAKSTDSFLSIYQDDEAIEYEILGGFTSVEQYKLGNGRVVGVVATFESVSPYAYSPINQVEYDVADTLSFIITSNSDELEGVVYPKITITNTTNVELVNSIGTIDNKFATVSIKNNLINEQIILDCTNKIITSNRLNRVIGDDFNFVWLPLISGENNITVTGSCHITFEWRDPYKIGSI